MHPAFLCVIQSVSDVFIQHCQTAPRCFTARAPSPGSLLPLSSWFLAQWSLSCLSFRRIMPYSCKSQLVWTRHSHKTRCWRFFAKSRFPLTLPFPIPSTLWHAVLGNAWKGAVEWNCITHSPVIVCYTWITITHHSNVLSIYFKVWPLSVWDHRRGVGDSFCARPQPPVEDAGTQQRWDRSDEAKVSCNFSLSLSIFRYAFELLDDSQCSPLAKHQYCSSAPTSKSISVKGWRKQFLSSPPPLFVHQSDKTVHSNPS